MKNKQWQKGHPLSDIKIYRQDIVMKKVCYWYTYLQCRIETPEIDASTQQSLVLQRPFKSLGKHILVTLLYWHVNRYKDQCSKIERPRNRSVFLIIFLKPTFSQPLFCLSLLFSVLWETSSGLPFQLHWAMNGGRHEQEMRRQEERKKGQGISSPFPPAGSFSSCCVSLQPQLLWKAVPSWFQISLSP